MLAGNKINRREARHASCLSDPPQRRWLAAGRFAAVRPGETPDWSCKNFKSGPDWAVRRATQVGDCQMTPRSRRNRENTAAGKLPAARSVTLPCRCNPRREACRALTLVTLAALAGAATAMRCSLQFASDACRPCRAMQPAVSRLISDGYPVQRIDVDQHPETGRQFGVKGVPTLCCSGEPRPAASAGADELRAAGADV